MAISKWALDAGHSHVEFSVRHMMISKVKGHFNQFSADIEADPEDLSTAKIFFTVQLDSIQTNNVERDEHLRSKDFFDVVNHPALTFRSTHILENRKDQYTVTGDVTLNGRTMPGTFIVSYEGQATDPVSGAEKVGFHVEGGLSRKEFGIAWNKVLETGGVMIGDDVQISLDIQAVQLDS